MKLTFVRRCNLTNKYIQTLTQLKESMERVQASMPRLSLSGVDASMELWDRGSFRFRIGMNYLTPEDAVALANYILSNVDAIPATSKASSAIVMLEDEETF